MIQMVCMVPKAGLEPARLAPPPPQDGVSTNSTTSATGHSFWPFHGLFETLLILLIRGTLR